MHNLNFVYTESSMINGLAYDEADSRLYIRFQRNGAVFSYADVSRKKFDHFLNAPSVGQYFHQHIKNHHEHRKESMVVNELKPISGE